MKCERVRNICKDFTVRAFLFIPTWFILAILAWSAIASLTENRFMFPGGVGFHIFCLLNGCIFLSKIFAFLRLPPLFGMLIAGILYRNFVTPLDQDLADHLRTFALLVILTSSGCGLDADALRKMGLPTTLLAIFPGFAEAVVVAMCSKLLLNFPWTYAIMLGLMNSPVSAAVAVPGLLGFQQQGFGVKKGIPTMIMAASSIDDVLTISGFAVIFGIAFSDGGAAWKLFSGILQSVAGVVYGIIMGSVCWLIPSDKCSAFVEIRVLIVTMSAVTALFGAAELGYDGFGALAVVVTAFVANVKWHKDWNKLGYNPVAKIYSLAWYMFEPLLFGLIGAEIDVETLEVHAMLKGLLILGLGLAIRMLVTFFTVSGAGLTRNERVFVALAWISKASVQAALASAVLTRANQKNLSDETKTWGRDILTIEVLAIMITAPLGSFGISYFAPRLLEKEDSAVHE